MGNSRYIDEKYMNDRIDKLEGLTSNISNRQPDNVAIENEALRRENEMLKQRLQMAGDPIRAEFEQSDEFRNAWMTNVVSYLYEANMAQWAQSPYAKKLDEWTSARIDEIRQSRTQKQAAQTVPKAKTAQQQPDNRKEND